MKHTPLRLGATILGLALLTATLSGCVVEGRGGHGWCWWHPYRCR